jgi:hypothetical protein
MKQMCAKCGQPLKDGDRVKAVVLSIFHEISSPVSYAIENPTECLSLEHVDCENPEPEEGPGAAA